MSQIAMLRSLDARMHAAFGRKDMSGTGTYTAPGGDPVPARCYVDNDQNDSVGDFAPTVGARTTVRILRADVAAPAMKAIVVVDGQTYRLAEFIQEDESASLWAVQRV